MKRWLRIFGVCFLAVIVGMVVADRLGGLDKVASAEDSSPCGRSVGPIKAHRVATEAVAARLKAPKTATFSSLRESQVARHEKERCRFQVTGYVDAQNSFGAMLRTGFVVEVQGSDTEPFKVLNVRVDRT
jgi:hypothetical protein